MGKPGQLYDKDFVLWTKEQAAALRRAKGSNLPLDWDNLAEEIEDLGKCDRRELASQIRRILRRLFKLEASRSVEPRAEWLESISDARLEIEDLLNDSPSLRRQIDRLIAEQLPRAAKAATDDLNRHGEPANAVGERLEKGGFIAAQVLEDWFPEEGG